MSNYFVHESSILDDDVNIGANATIICGNTIGKYALNGAGSLISKDVKNFALVVGVPAKQIGWVLMAGNRLDFNKKILQLMFLITLSIFWRMEKLN